MTERSLLRLLSTSRLSSSNEEEPWAPADSTVSKTLNGKAPITCVQPLDLHSVATEALTTTSAAESTALTSFSTLFAVSAAVSDAVACIEEIENDSSPSPTASSASHASEQDSSETSQTQGLLPESTPKPATFREQAKGRSNQEVLTPTLAAQRAPTRTQSIDSLDFSDLMDWTINSNIESLVDSLATFAHDSDEVFCLLPASAGTNHEPASKNGRATPSTCKATQRTQHEASEAPSISMDIKLFNPTLIEQRSVAPMNAPTRRGSLVERADNIDSDRPNKASAPTRTISLRLSDLGITPRQLLDYIPREALQQALDRCRAEAKIKCMIQTSTGTSSNSASSDVNNDEGKGRCDSVLRNGTISCPKMTCDAHADTSSSSSNDDSIDVFTDPTPHRNGPQRDCQSSFSLHSTQADALSSIASSANKSAEHSLRHAQISRPPERPCRRGSVVPSIEVSETETLARPQPDELLLTGNPSDLQRPDPHVANEMISPCRPESTASSPKHDSSPSKLRDSLLERHLQGQSTSRRKNMSGSKSLSSLRSKRDCGKSLCSEATSKVSNRVGMSSRTRGSSSTVDMQMKLRKKSLHTMLTGKERTSSRPPVGGAGEKSVASAYSTQSSTGGRRRVRKSQPGATVGRDSVSQDVSVEKTTVKLTVDNRAPAKDQDRQSLHASEPLNLLPKVTHKKSIKHADNSGGESVLLSKKVPKKSKAAADVSESHPYTDERPISQDTCLGTCDDRQPPKSSRKKKSSYDCPSASPSSGDRVRASSVGSHKVVQKAKSQYRSRSLSRPKTRSACMEKSTLASSMSISDLNSGLQMMRDKQRGHGILQVVKDAFRKGSLSTLVVEAQNQMPVCELTDNDFTSTSSTSLSPSAQPPPNNHRVAIRLRSRLEMLPGDRKLIRRSLSQPRSVDGSLAARSLGSASLSVAKSEAAVLRKRIRTKPGVPKKQVKSSGRCYMANTQSDERSLEEQFRQAGISESQLKALSQMGITITRLTKST